MASHKDGAKSISISDIPKEDLEETFLDFANGNKAMANLLMECYKHNVETFGNHVGPRAYIDFIVNNSHNEIRDMMRSVEIIDGIQIDLLLDGGNPFGSEKFYIPTFSIGFKTQNEEHASSLFNKMSEALKRRDSLEDEKSGIFDFMFKFYNLLAEKGTDLNLWAKYESGQYSFHILNKQNKRNAEYFKEIFGKAGLTYKKDESGSEQWEFVSDTADNFREVLIKVEQIIESNWTLDKPTQITDDMSFSLRAKMLREEFGLTPEGINKFKEWLKIEEEKVYARMQQLTMKNVVTNAIDKGISEDSVQEADTIESKEIHSQTMKGITIDEK